MEKRKAVKLEDSIRSWSFSDYFPSRNYPNTGLLDLSNDGENNSIGFMELMGFQDFGSSIFDMSQVPLPSTMEPPPDHNQTSKVPPESSEVLNQPTAPNSSSISSASTGAPSDDQTKSVEGDDDEDNQEHQKTKKQGCELRYKTNQKRQKEPRFAFKTKSEVDHLEDGYRWRKYGQKAVKNSHFPRSYYRCTTASCNVKKRVERCFSDPSIVVTTYEGQHTHHSPVMLPPRPTGFPPVSGISTGAVGSYSLPLQMTLSSHQLSQLHNSSTLLNCGYMGSSNTTAMSLHERGFCTPASALIGDINGLLPDIMPSIMKKEH